MVSRSLDRKSTRLNSSHSQISYAVFCLKKKKKKINISYIKKKKKIKHKINIIKNLNFIITINFYYFYYYFNSLNSFFFFFFFFFNDTATTEIYTLSLHDALPISVSIPASAVLIASSP